MGHVQRELCPNAQTETGGKPFPWFALAVKPLHEHAVAQCLEFKRLEVYLPVFRSTRRWSDRLKTIVKPVFPGYVFCRLDLNRRIAALRTPGVRRIVASGGEITPLSELEIDSIRLMVKAGPMVEPWPLIRVGQQVQVHSGPFTGLKGILVNDRNSCRVVISLELLQRSLAVQVDRSCIVPTSS